MTAYEIWAARWPQAAEELQQALTAQINATAPGNGGGKPEGATQQQSRFRIAEQGAMSWRNNVGATPAHCRECGAPQQPVRYGLANDSERLNEQIKSSDLILAIPRLITPAHVGQTIAQFGAVECKAEGWQWSGSKREKAQAAWLSLVAKLGGYAAFSTGDVRL